MTYLVNPRPRHKLPGVMSADELGVRFPTVHRATGRLIGGMFTEVEQAGVDEQRLEIVARDPIADHGLSGVRSGWNRLTIVRSAEAVRKHIRRLREDDDMTILAIDAEIEGYKLKIREARERRKTAVKAAWKRGEDVPLREIVDLIANKET